MSDSKWAIKDGGHIIDIVKALEELLESDDGVGGDPGKFQDHLSFLSMMNEKKGGLGPTFTHANEPFAKFPVGTLPSWYTFTDGTRRCRHVVARHQRISSKSEVAKVI